MRPDPAACRGIPTVGHAPGFSELDQRAIRNHYRPDMGFQDPFDRCAGLRAPCLPLRRLPRCASSRLRASRCAAAPPAARRPPSGGVISRAAPESLTRMGPGGAAPPVKAPTARQSKAAPARATGWSPRYSATLEGGDWRWRGGRDRRRGTGGSAPEIPPDGRLGDLDAVGVRWITPPAPWPFSAIPLQTRSSSMASPPTTGSIGIKTPPATGSPRMRSGKSRSLPASLQGNSDGPTAVSSTRPPAAGATPSTATRTVICTGRV